MDRWGPVFRSMAIIEAQIQEKLTVESLAASVHFSRHHYQRLFQEAVGESVMRYVSRRRLTLAAQALAQTGCTVLQIALQYGYDSHEGFTRSFRAHFGMTPTEYRRYHGILGLPPLPKERESMTHTKAAQDILRELNSLTVQASEAAAQTEKLLQDPQLLPFYKRFWALAAGRAQALAASLGGAAAQITDAAQDPQKIAAGLAALHALEEGVLLSQATAFQIRLTVARAQPAHRALFAPLCERYGSLAQNARLRVEKAAAFCQDLADLIFQDMRTTARQLLQAAAEQGQALAGALTARPDLPYGYLADAANGIAAVLTGTPLEEMTAAALEEQLLRARVLAFSVDIDLLRMPEHQPLFAGLAAFVQRLEEAAAFFQSLAETFPQPPAPRPAADTMAAGGAKAKAAAGADTMAAGTEAAAPHTAPAAASRSELGFCGELLLFCLKGEVQKLAHVLEESRQAALLQLCGQLQQALQLLHSAGATEADAAGVCSQAVDRLQAVHAALTQQAAALDSIGGPLALIGEELAGFTARVAAAASER